MRLLDKPLCLSSSPAHLLRRMHTHKPNRLAHQAIAKGAALQGPLQ
jgi:hypothetical protein